MKHPFIKLLALLLLPAMLCACAGDTEIRDDLPFQEIADGSSSEERPAILPEALSLPYYPGQSLDPITCPDGPQQTVAALLCEGLFELDEQFAPQPRLCASYTYDAAALTYTFALRSDARFSDGSPLTAGDVVSTLNRARGSARYGARLAGVSAVKAGSDAVLVTLSTPDTALPALLDVPIVKAGAAESAPVGAGAYRLVSAESGAYLETNPNWRGGTQPVEQILLKPVESADAMLYQFASHETQLLTSDLTGASPVSVTGSIQFYDADSTVFQFVGMNSASPALASSAVRKALGLGIDRVQTVSAFLSGHGKAAQFPISPVCGEYPAALEQSYSYDAFQQAMTDAGCAAGASKPLTMLVNEESSFKVSMARHIAEALSAFDLKIDVKVLPWAEYSAALTAGKFDLYYGEVKLSANWNLRPLLATGGALNYGGVSDPVLDALLTAAMAADDRTAAIEALCRRIQSTAPILPVCFKTVSVLVQSGVIENLTPTAADPFYALADCTVHLRPKS